MARTFQEVLERLLQEKYGGSVSALAKRFGELHGGSRDDNRKQIRRHLGKPPDKIPVEPTEEMIVRYAEAFGVSRNVFPPAVSPRQARGRGLAEAHERIRKLEAREPQIGAELAAIRALLPDPPANPGPPTRPRPRRR